MKMHKTVEAFFGNPNENAIINILTAAIFVVRSIREEKFIDLIFEVVEIKREGPLFYKDLQESLAEIKLSKKGEEFHSEMLHSSSQMQQYPHLWPYYALYWSMNMKENSIEKLIGIFSPKIAQSVLHFHYVYLKMKKNEKSIKEEEKYSQKYYEEVAISVTRSIEYLVQMQSVRSEYLYEKYLRTDIDDIVENFLTIATGNVIESESFFIMQNDEEEGNYLKYENSDNSNISFAFYSTRKIKKGTSKTLDANRNIINYFQNGLEKYLPLKLFLLNGQSKKIGGGGKRGKQKGQYTQVEPLVENLFVVERETRVESAMEEKIEQESKIIHRKRAFPDPDRNDEDIPNAYQQKKRNRAYSAAITKNRLMLSCDYAIPPKKHYAAFISHVVDKQLSASYGEVDIFNIIFLTTVLSGFVYEDVIKIFFLNLNGKFVYDHETGILKLQVTSKAIRQKGKSDYLQGAEKDIEYKYPVPFIRLLAKLRNLFSHTDFDQELWTNIDQKRKYDTYIGKKILSFQYRINFKPTSTWRILNSYRRMMLKEDISTILCLSKNLQNDESKLAYASTPKRSQPHSKYLEMLYIDLNIDDVVKKISRDEEEYKETVIPALQPVYAGSNRAFKPEISRIFFRDLQQKIRIEEDFEKEFNLSALYTRFALSLLLGTRTFKGSCVLNRISFAMHALIISEKSETLLSGARIIPLCDRAEFIIKKYQEKALKSGIPDDDIYLIYNGTFVPFDEKIAITVARASGFEEDKITILRTVPINTGRHVLTKYGAEWNINGYYLEAFLGHYFSGAEQFGIFSSMNIQEYIATMREFMQKIADVYGILELP
jgi:hypothetical protein